MKAAIEYLKQNALNIACFFGLSGATLFALLGEGSCMPESSKKLVAEALDNGECIVTVDDMPRLNAAAALAEKGIFWSPRTASDRFPIHISPEYVTEIREHRSEWLGM